MRPPRCLGVCLSPHINFRTPEPIFMKLGMYIMTPEPISSTYIIDLSHVPVCLQVYPLNVANQRLGKNVTEVSNMDASIEELFNASFPMRYVSYQRNVGDHYFPDLLVSKQGMQAKLKTSDESNQNSICYVKCLLQLSVNTFRHKEQLRGKLDGPSLIGIVCN